ncbi:MAG TPA: class I SAM-dependent methyltransferase [Streptosporangiaceae bacterium]|nr:class I SAM-dependent methyltransferase [Streptosporangiaceae bacterium]
MDDANQVSDTDPPAYRSTEQYARRAKSFGSAASQYAQHRPDYALEAVRWVLAPVASGAGQRRPIDVLDLGAGTGKLTGQLAGLRLAGGPLAVIAVEPDQDMLAELRRQLPGVTAIEGKAEEIPLPDASVDAVLAGQAAHWFDLDRAIPEMARVLRPGGVLGGLWNADDNRVGWVASLHEASGRRTVVPIGGDERDDEGMTGWLDQAGQGLFKRAEEEEFPNSQTRTADSLVATLSTHSAFLIMEPGEREQALGRVRTFLAKTPETACGEFQLPMTTLAIRAIRL